MITLQTPDGTQWPIISNAAYTVRYFGLVPRTGFDVRFVNWVLALYDEVNNRQPRSNITLNWSWFHYDDHEKPRVGDQPVYKFLHTLESK